VARKGENLTRLVSDAAIRVERATYQAKHPGQQVGGGLVTKWRGEFSPYVAQVIDQAGEIDPDDRQSLDRLGAWVIDLARGGTTQVTHQAATRRRPCTTCGGKNRDTDQHPGRSTVWNRDTKTYDLCPDCDGAGEEEISAVA
jgi:hypothetical protein